MSKSGDRSGNLAGRKVLVAEDHKANRFLIARFLADAGLDVRFAEDGRAAVDAFVAERPDVVLMDVSMPVMDGLAATQEIRRPEGGGPRCPIVRLTANAFEEDRRRCYDAGMTGFMPKPVKRAELVAAPARRPRAGACRRPGRGVGAASGAALAAAWRAPN